MHSSVPSIQYDSIIEVEIEYEHINECSKLYINKFNRRVLMKGNVFMSMNFFIIFGIGIGIYLMVYSFMENIEVSTGIPVILGTLIGYSIYSTYELTKMRRILLELVF